MTIFVTGATGYIGSYVVDTLLRETEQRLSLLVRADSEQQAHERLWQSLQLHMDFDTFAELVRRRVEVVRGDLTSPSFGLEAKPRQQLNETITSIIHCAASLNRKSSKACFNVNLRGTLEVIKLARAAHDHHGLKRFSDVSTVAACGHRHHEVVGEDDCIDWERSDYDPYARTKKMCEHMLAELLPDVPRTVFRPSIVLGDSRRPETTQFDMVRAFVFLASLPVLPLPPEARCDIVPADFVGPAIARIHVLPKPKHHAYHLSAGTASLTYRDIVGAMLPELRQRGGLGALATRLGTQLTGGFVPALAGPFGAAVSVLGSLRQRHPVVYGASLMKVFWPYLVFDTVFDNAHTVEALGAAPAPFRDYAAGLYRFATGGGFTYPYEAWPAGVTLAATPAPRARRAKRA